MPQVPILRVVAVQREFVAGAWLPKTDTDPNTRLENYGPRVSVQPLAFCLFSEKRGRTLVPYSAFHFDAQFAYLYI